MIRKTGHGSEIIFKFIFLRRKIGLDLSETKTNNMSYFSEIITQKPFEEALESVRNALKESGFGIVSEINMQQKLMDALGQVTKKYMILGACSPHHALLAVTHEPNIGVLLPCNIVVAENNDGSSRIAAVNPMTAMQAVGNNQLGSMALEVSDMLNKVLSLI